MVSVCPAAVPSATLVPVSPPSVVDKVCSAVMSEESVVLLPEIVPVTVPPVLAGLVPVLTRLPVILSLLRATVPVPQLAPRPTLPLIGLVLEPLKLAGLKAMIP